MNFNLPQTMLRISLLVLFCSGLFAQSVFAQKQKIIDSLMLAIKSTKDTALVDVYNEISYEYKNIDIEKTLLYADTAIIKSKKNKLHTRTRLCICQPWQLL